MTGPLMVVARETTRGETVRKECTIEYEVLTHC